MFKKLLMLAGVVVAAMALTITASAATFTSSDGVLSIELPNETWREVQDPTKWIVLSDGANTISIEHYSNGDTLPSMAVADDHYVKVYQAVFSTQNEVFIITGYAVDEMKITEICNSIMSAKVLQYDTKLAVKNAQTANTSRSGFTVEPMSGTFYVDTDGLNVRSSWSSTSEVIGGLLKGAAVNVTGKVMQNGADYGWYQISFEGLTGYVNSSFLTTTAPEASTSESTGIQYTGRVKTIYEIDGHAVTVYETADGSWYDSEGNRYSQVTDYDFVADNGAPLTVNKPNLATSPAGEPFTVFWQNGNATTLTLYEDGYLYSEDWVRYVQGEGGTYIGADGTVLYDEEPDLSQVAPQLVQCPYCGEWYEEGNIFRNHYCPERDAANGVASGNGEDEDVIDLYLSGGLVLHSYDGGASYVDDRGVYYWREDGGWTSGDGNHFMEMTNDE